MKLNAAVISLEHRYYGQSYPYGIADTKLDYLSSQQYLQDVINFQKFIAAEYNIETNITIILPITFGSLV